MKAFCVWYRSSSFSIFRVRFYIVRIYEECVGLENFHHQSHTLLFAFAGTSAGPIMPHVFGRVDIKTRVLFV